MAAGSLAIETMSKRSRRPLPRGRHSDGLTAEQVAADQLGRLFGAMIDLAATVGYDATSTRELAQLARVSKQAMYRLVGSKERYFAATYESVVARVFELMREACLGERDSRRRLRAGLRALCAEAAKRPRAARLVLVEPPFVGERAVARMEEVRAAFEEMVGAALDLDPGGAVVPSPIVRGVVRGAEHVIRMRVLEGRAQELPRLADRLAGWALSYRTSALGQLPIGSQVTVRRRAVLSRLPSDDERVRMLRVVARGAAAGGHQVISPSYVAREAGIRARRVKEVLGQDPRRYVLDAAELYTMEALIFACREARGGSDRSVGTHLAAMALVERLVQDRTLCRIAFGEIPRLGRAGMERREALIGKLARALARSLPAGADGGRLAAEAAAGAAWALLGEQAAAGWPASLRALSVQVSYLALAPAIGAENAIETIRRGRHAGLRP